MACELYLNKPIFLITKDNLDRAMFLKHLDHDHIVIYIFLSLTQDKNNTHTLNTKLSPSNINAHYMCFTLF